MEFMVMPAGLSEYSDGPPRGVEGLSHALEEGVARQKVNTSQSATKGACEDTEETIARRST